MNTIDTIRLLKKISADLKLGIPQTPPAKIPGGYTHTMYRLQTDEGSFAVKLLNPLIMKRTDAFENYQTAENLEEKLHAAKIPIVPAIEFEGKKMQCIHGQYYYVFHWMDGKMLKSNEIQEEHCAIIGRILAQMHGIEKRPGEYLQEDLRIDWDAYIQMAHTKCPVIAPLLLENRELLYTSQRHGNDAQKKLPRISCLCNGDMDSKNVLWVNGSPHIIDLECLHYGNPYIELFELALCWSGYDHCSIDYDLLKAFVRSYVHNHGMIEVDWRTLYHSNHGRLEWLAYNIKRALMIEAQTQEEKKLGIEQVIGTMEQIVYYDHIKHTLIEQLETLDA